MAKAKLVVAIIISSPVLVVVCCLAAVEALAGSLKDSFAKAVESIGDICGVNK